MVLSDAAVKIRFPDIEKIDLELESPPNESLQWLEFQESVCTYLGHLQGAIAMSSDVEVYHRLRQQFGCTVPSAIEAGKSSMFDLAMEIGFYIWNENRANQPDSNVAKRMPYLFTTQKFDIEKHIYDPEPMMEWMKTIDQNGFDDANPPPATKFKTLRVIVPLTFLQALHKQAPTAYEAGMSMVNIGMFDYQDLQEKLKRNVNYVQS